MCKCCGQFSVSMLEWVLGQISLPYPLCLLLYECVYVYCYRCMCSFGIKVGLRWWSKSWSGINVLSCFGVCSEPLICFAWC